MRTFKLLTTSVMFCLALLLLTLSPNPLHASNPLREKYTATRKKLNDIDSKIENELKGMIAAPRSEFETADDYGKRIAKIETTRSELGRKYNREAVAAEANNLLSVFQTKPVQLELVSFDINNETYSGRVTVEESNMNIKFKIHREDAKALKDNEQSLTTIGYFDLSSAQLECLVAMALKIPGSVIPVMVETEPLTMNEDIEEFSVYGNSAGMAEGRAKYVFSPDGQYVTSDYHLQYKGDFVRVWNVSTGKVQSNTYIGDGYEAPLSLHYLGAKNSIVGFNPNKIVFVDPEKEVIVRTIPFSGPLSGSEILQISQNANYILLGTRNKVDRSPIIVLQYLPTDQKVAEYPYNPDYPHPSAFSPDDKFFVLADYEKVSIYETANGERVRTIPSKIGERTRIEIGTICFDPSSRYIAAACNDGSVRVWEIENGMLMSTSGERVGVFSISPSGNYIASSNHTQRYNKIEIYELLTGRRIRSFDKAINYSSSPSVFSPDSKFMVFATDRQAQSLNLTLGRVAEMKHVAASYKGSPKNIERQSLLLKTYPSQPRVETAIVPNSVPLKIRLTISQENLADSVSITTTFPVCLSGNEFIVDRLFAFQDTSSVWSSTIGRASLSNTVAVFEPTKGSKRQITFGPDGSASILADELVGRKFESEKFGRVVLPTGLTAEVTASVPLVRHYVAAYVRAKDFDGITGMLVVSSLPDSILAEFREAAITIGKARAATALQTKNYSQVVSTASKLFSLGYEVDEEFRKSLRQVPISLIPSYDFAQRIFYPECDLGTFLSDLKQCQGKVIEIPGAEILQVIASKGFLLSLTKTNVVYCSVSDPQMLSNIYDGNPVKLLGTVTGTNTYVTPRGSTNTVPAIAIIAVQNLR